MGLALLSVAGILGWGIITMGRAGEYNRNKSNLIMRYRIIFQAVTLLIFIVPLWLKRNSFSTALTSRNLSDIISIILAPKFFMHLHLHSALQRTNKW